MIASGPITQVAWVTDDLEATETLLREQFGSGAWTRIPDVRFEPEHCTTAESRPTSPCTSRSPTSATSSSS